MRTKDDCLQILFEWKLTEGGIMTYFIDDFTYRLNEPASINWDCFYHRWRKNVLTLKNHPKDPEYATIIDDWCHLLLSYSWEEEKQAVEDKLSRLNLDSLDRLERILFRYDEQFSLLLEEAAGYDDFDNLVGFLEDLPDWFLESIEFLEQNQIESNITVNTILEKLEFFPLPQEGNYRPNIEDVDISQHLFFGGEWKHV